MSLSSVAVTNSLLFWTWQEQQQATRISFYGSDKITINVTSEKMGVKQGGHLHGSLCPASAMRTFIPHRWSVGGLSRGGEWLGARSNAQILPVWETDFCSSVGADGAHRQLPVWDRWVCSSPGQPDHHQSPERPSRPAPHLLQLLSDEAGVQTQGAVAVTDRTRDMRRSLNVIMRYSATQWPWGEVQTEVSDYSTTRSVYF